VWKVSVPGHALRCGPETSVTSPLRCWQVQLGAAFANCFEISIPSPRRWECGNPKGISKECGKGGKPASRLSMLSTLCHFHGLLFARQMQDKPICRDQCNLRHSPRAVHGYSSLVNECIGDLSSAKKRNQPTSFRKTNLPRNRLQIRQELQSLSALYSGTLDLTHERCNIYAEHSLRPTFIRLRRCLRSRNGRCHHQSGTSESPDDHHPG